ncbi:YcxB family protein [Armatimonas sp.]|uniref:YcxB family protein n=1 Tax=Armatimonas sp. TaxID=1872638 RepID=UPI0034D9646B
MPAPQSLFWLAALIGGGCVLFRILDSVVRSRDIRVSIRRAIRLREGKGILGEYSYELTQDGLVTRSTLGTETCFWSAVESIVETPGYIFLRTSKLDYLLIPKHAFSSPQHQAEFLAQVESFRLGQNAPPTPLKSAWYQSKDQT